MAQSHPRSSSSLSRPAAGGAAANGSGPLAPQLPTHSGRFSTLSIVGLAYAVLNSPTAASASLSLVLPSGGGVGVFAGMIVSGFGVWCIAASMAEICAVLPTFGGPYHWTYLLSTPKHRRWMSYFCGWASCAGWVALSATTSSLLSSLVPGIISLMHPDSYEEKPWHVFLIFIALAIFACLVNCFGARWLDVINRAALFWSVGGVVVIGITVLATASPKYQSGHFVFASFQNSTGWPDGMAFLLGLLQSTFALVGSDAAAHLTAEVPRPARNASLAMIIAPLIGASSALIITIIYLFVLTDFDAVISSGAGPLLEILYQSTGSRAGAISLYMFPCFSMVFAAIAILCASSRQVQAFAVDGGLPFSRIFAHEVERFGTPIAAITLVTFWVFVFGLIVLGSETALNSILSSSVVMLQLTYCVPVLLVLFRGRRLLSSASSSFLRPRHFNLGAKLGPIVGAWGCLFAIVTSVLFCFPSEIPTSGSTMNYVCVVLGVVALLALLSWALDGRRNFQGPVGVQRNIAVALHASGMMGEPVDLDEEKASRQTQGAAQRRAEDASQEEVVAAKQ